VRAGRPERNGFDPSLRWRTLDTAHFSLHFADKHRAQPTSSPESPRRCNPRLTGWLRWRPESRVHLVLLDSADFSNGFASPLPFNYTMIFLNPARRGELLQNRAWLELVLTPRAHARPCTWTRPVAGRSCCAGFSAAFPSCSRTRWSPAGSPRALAVYSESDPAKQFSVEDAYPDYSPPTTTVSLAGKVGDNGWYTSSGSSWPIALTAVDGPAGNAPDGTSYAYGVNQTYYKIDDGVWNTYKTPFAINSQGKHTVYYYSTDNAGHSEEVNAKNVWIDEFAPTGG